MEQTGHVSRPRRAFLEVLVGLKFVLDLDQQLQPCPRHGIKHVTDAASRFEHQYKFRIAGRKTRLRCNALLL